MTKNFVLTLAGIITVAVTGIEFSNPTYAQSNNSQIVQETEPNTNNNQTPRESNNNPRVIVVPSYPTQDRIERSNFDVNRSQRARDFYQNLMEPYHQRHNLYRNSVPSYQYRQNYDRSSYRR